MKELSNNLLTLVFLISWMAGIILAKGFWLTLVAILFPPAAWYILIERRLVVTGWLV